MKRVIVPALVVALLLTGAGIFLRHHDPSAAYTANRDAWLAYQEGDRLLQAFRHADAESLLLRAVGLDPDFAPAHVALSELFDRRGHVDRARKHLALADSLAAALGDRRGRVLLQLRLAGQRDSRYHAHHDSLLELGRELAPRDIDVLISEAHRASLGEDLARAEEIWRSILEINPNYANAYNYLGYLYLGQGRYTEAETAMRRYAYIAPELANPHDSLGEVLLTIGRYEEAETEFLTALRKQQDFYYSMINLSYLYLARGQVQRALELSEVLLQTFAGTALEHQYVRTLINWLFIHGLHELLPAYAERFLTAESDPRKRAFVELQLQLSRGNAAAAAALVDSLHADYRAAPWHPHEPPIAAQVELGLLRYRAVVVQKLGLHQAAIDLLQEAMERGKHLPPHGRLLDQIYLAYNLAALGRLDEARVQIRQVLSINPRQAEALLIAAGIEAASEREEEALRLLDALQQALREADDDFPPLRDARRLREQIDHPDHI